MSVRNIIMYLPILPSSCSRPETPAVLVSEIIYSN